MIPDGSVSETPSITESDDEEMKTAMAAVHSSSRTFTEVGGLLNQQGAQCQRLLPWGNNDYEPVFFIFTKISGNA